MLLNFSQTDINDSLFSDQMDTGTRSGSCTSTGMEASTRALAVILALVCAKRSEWEITNI